MTSREWPKCARLLLGFLIAPALAPVSLIVLLIALAAAGNADCPAAAPLWLYGIVRAGIPASYACAVFMGLPYVLWMRKRGELDFWAVMAPVLGLILPLFVLLFVIGAMVDLSVGVTVVIPFPGIMLSALCFYFVSVSMGGTASHAHQVHPARPG